MDGTVPEKAELSQLGQSIIKTIIYADLFDYPLKLHEIHKLLIGRADSPEAIADCLENHQPVRDKLDASPPFWFLAGRQEIVELRQERQVYSQNLWNHFQKYERWLSRIPFIRLVAISGSLAMNNVSHSKDDIDLLLVTHCGRVWLGRALCLLVVRIAARQGIELCPNYIIAEDRLRLESANLFTAHELAQLIPVAGLKVYRHLLNNNAWVWEYLPNAVTGSRNMLAADGNERIGYRPAELVLGGSLGDVLENWERNRKINRLSRESLQRGSVETVFDPHVCKGHMVSHAGKVQKLYHDNLRLHGIDV